MSFIFVSRDSPTLAFTTSNGLALRLNHFIMLVPLLCCAIPLAAHVAGPHGWLSKPIYALPRPTPSGARCRCVALRRLGVPITVRRWRNACFLVYPCFLIPWSIINSWARRPSSFKLRRGPYAPTSVNIS